MPPTAARTGRPSIFRDKDLGKPVRGYLTDEGKDGFESARKALAALVGWEVKDVTNSDVVEYLARGDEDTIAYLRATGQIK